MLMRYVVNDAINCLPETCQFFLKSGSTQAIYFYVPNCTVFLLVSEQDNELKIKFSNLCTNITSELICDGNRTEWSPIRSVIIQVITKQDSHLVGVQFFSSQV